MNRAAEYLEKKGRRVICWNEAANGGIPRWFAVADTAWNGRDEKNYREFRLAAKSYCDALRKMGVSSAPECDWDESPQKRLRETLAFADNLMTKNMLRQLLNVEE